MWIEVLEGALALSALGAAYFELKARKTCNQIRKANEEEEDGRPKIVPYEDPLYSFLKGVSDIFRGLGLQGENLDRICRELMEKDINGSKSLKWNQTYFLGFHFVNTWDADSVREILFAKDEVVGKQDFGQRLNQEFLSEAIISVEGDEWRRQKKILSPAFTYDHLKVITPEVVIVADQLVEKLKLKANQPINVHSLLQLATLDVIGRTGFGVDFGALTENNKSPELENYEKFVKELQNPLHFFEKIDTLLGTHRRVYDRLERFEKYMLSLVEAKKRSIEEKGDEYKPADILDMLVMAHDNGDGILNDRQLIHNLNTFFIAGHETTAGGVSSAIHLLAENPLQQQKLYEEIIGVCGHSPPSHEQLKELEYLHNVVKETLRLFPPAPVMVRKSKTDIVISGYKIPKETTFGLWVYTIHRNPQYWENPDSFDPDRFLDANKDKRHRYAWVPFSLGPRQCIGNNLAMMEMKILIARVIQKFQIVPDPHSLKPNLPYMSLVTHPHPKNTILLIPRN